MLLMNLYEGFFFSDSWIASLLYFFSDFSEQHLRPRQMSPGRQIKSLLLYFNKSQSEFTTTSRRLIMSQEQKLTATGSRTSFGKKKTFERRRLKRSEEKMSLFSVLRRLRRHSEETKSTKIPPLFFPPLVVTHNDTSFSCLLQPGNEWWENSSFTPFSYSVSQVLWKHNRPPSHQRTCNTLLTALVSFFLFSFFWERI